MTTKTFTLVVNKLMEQKQNNTLINHGQELPPTELMGGIGGQ